MTNANEPAYPVEISIGQNGEIMGCQTSNNTGFSIGLSKREVMAKDFMAALIASGGDAWTPQLYARLAIGAADELIKQLNSTKEE